MRRTRKFRDGKLTLLRRLPIAMESGGKEAAARAILEKVVAEVH
jgi:hypothetical protein